MLKRNNINQAYLFHSGIKGQKWGVRRFQNEDGSLTEEGKKKYGKGTKAYGEIVRDSNKLATSVSNATGNDKKRLANKYAKESLEEKIKNDVDKHNKEIDDAEKAEEIEKNNDINSMHKSTVDAINQTRNTTNNIKQLVNDSYTPKASRMDLKNMSNKELQDAINREYLERNYNDMFNEDLAKKKNGKEHVMKALTIAGDVLAAAGSCAVLALTILEIKGKVGKHK